MIVKIMIRKRLFPVRYLPPEERDFLGRRSGMTSAAGESVFLSLRGQIDPARKAHLPANEAERPISPANEATYPPAAEVFRPRNWKASRPPFPPMEAIRAVASYAESKGRLACAIALLTIQTKRAQNTTESAPKTARIRSPRPGSSTIATLRRAIP